MSVPLTFSLEGKRALVTGAGRGLGAAMARGLAEAGATVALVSRSEKELVSTAESIGESAVPLVADVADPGSASELVDAAEAALGGPVDIVIHAAGVQHRQPAESFPIEEWERVLAVNLTAPFRLSQELGRRQLAESRGGSHIFVGSLASHLAVGSASAYTASKSGVFGLLRVLSLEWSGRGIRVNGIGPGYIRTALTEPLFEDPVRQQKLFDRIPMHRFGTPEDMAGTAVFLASDASAYITGQLIMVDGGWSSA